MAVATIEAGVLRTGNGVVVEFAFPFRAQVSGDIKVASVVGQVLTVLLPATYTVLLAASSGTVTFGVAPLNGAVIYIYRETAQTQLVSVSSQNAYNPIVVESVWDKLTMLAQELSAAIVRSVKVAPGGNADTLVAQIIAAQAASAASAAEADADRIAAAASAAAAAASATLPPLAGNALRMLRVNTGATAAEWRTPGQVLTAIAAAPLAGAEFTGQVSSTAGDVNLKTVTSLANAAATLTAAQLLTGLFTITPTVARILTTATGTQIATALGGSVAGSHVAFTIVNLAAFDVTLAAGAGVTIVGRAVINNGSGTWRIRVDSASAVTIYAEAALNTKGDLNAAGSAPIYACRAWVNFNGTGTVVIRASGNVSSITDNGVGEYTVNFATAMQDANYAMAGSGEDIDAVGDVIIGRPNAGTKTSAACLVRTISAGLAAQDFPSVELVFFR